jgi:hypothetical protein
LIVGSELNFDDMWLSAQPMMSFREARHSILMHATLRCGQGGGASARVRNISRGGMMAECRFRGAAGDRVDVFMQGLGEVAGTVAWVGPGRIGVSFDEPVDPSTVLRRGKRRSAAPAFVPPSAGRPGRPAIQAH